MRTEFPNASTTLQASSNEKGLSDHNVELITTIVASERQQISKLGTAESRSAAMERGLCEWAATGRFDHQCESKAINNRVYVYRVQHFDTKGNLTPRVSLLYKHEVGFTIKRFLDEDDMKVLGGQHWTTTGGAPLIYDEVEVDRSKETLKRTRVKFYRLHEALVGSGDPKYRRHTHGVIIVVFWYLLIRMLL